MKYSRDELDKERIDELLGALAKLASRGMGSVAKTGAKASSSLGKFGAKQDAKKKAKLDKKQNLRRRSALAKQAKKKEDKGDLDVDTAVGIKAKRKKLARERLAAKGIELKSNKKNPKRVKKGDLGGAKREFDTETMTTKTTPATTAGDKFRVAMRQRKAKKRLTMSTEVDGDQISEAKKKVEDMKPSYGDYIPNPELSDEEKARFDRLRGKTPSNTPTPEQSKRIKELRAKVAQKRALAKAKAGKTTREADLKNLRKSADFAKMYRDLGIDPSDADIEKRAQKALPDIEANYRANSDRYFGSQDHKDAADRGKHFRDTIDQEKKIMKLDPNSVVPSEILPTPPSSPNADYSVNTKKGDESGRREIGTGRVKRESGVSRANVFRGIRAVNRNAKAAIAQRDMGPKHPDIPVADRGEESPETALGGRLARISRQRAARRAAFGRLNPKIAKQERAKAVAQIKQNNLDNFYRNKKGKLAPMKGDGDLGPTGDEPRTPQQIAQERGKRDRMFDFKKGLAASSGNDVRHRLAHRRAIRRRQEEY